MATCTRYNRALVSYGLEATFGDGNLDHECRVNTLTFGDMGRETRESQEIMATDVAAPAIVVTKPDTVTAEKDVSPMISTVPNTAPVLAGSAGLLPLDAAIVALGAVATGGIGTVQADSTTTLLKLDTDEGAEWKVGQIGFVQSTAATGSIPMAFRVAEIDGDDLVLAFAMPAAPLIGGTVVGSTGAYKSSASAAFSLALQRLGENLDDTVKAVGMAPTQFELDCQPREIPKVTLSWQAAAISDPVHDSEHAGIADVNDPWPMPLQVQGGGLQIVPYTPATSSYGTPILAQGGIKLMAAIDQATVDGMHGSSPNGIAGQCATRRRVSVELRPSFLNYASGATPGAGEGAYWYSAYKARDQFGVLAWFGAWPSMIAVSLSAGQITACPPPEDANGRSVIPLTIEERVYDGDDALADDECTNATAAVAWANGTYVAP